jgi:hypothetical protein
VISKRSAMLGINFEVTPFQMLGVIRVLEASNEA